MNNLFNQSMSDIVVKYCIENRQSLPIPKNPLYNYFMKDFVICFSVHDKHKTRMTNDYLNLIRYMGGQSRKDMKSGRSFERTHLIESKTDSDNYNLAVIYNLPILCKEWIDHVWQNRREINFNPNDENILAKYRLKPFTDLRIALYNFRPKELAEKTKLIIEYGGYSISFCESNTTHLVINDHTEIDCEDIQEQYTNLPKFIVSESWLTKSIETNYRQPEDEYLINLPFNENKLINNLMTNDCSFKNSILSSPNFDKSFDESSLIAADKNDLKKQAITQELYQTENNYVTILKDIIKIFSDPLKNHQFPGELPNEIELKTIFGGLPPIIDVHQKILDELEPVVKNWKAENEIGKIFQKHKQDFLTVYPQYVNFYEKTKEMIEQCVKKYPRFKSFLKASQESQECRKQTFQELLINPIQRLPRIELYLRTLLNSTDELHPDHKLLNDALETIISVNKVINLGKKKIEGQMELFELMNDIEDCPATLLSANRHFIAKCDVKILLEKDGIDDYEQQFIRKLENNLFTLLLFTDCILLCKKRIVTRSTSLKDRANIPMSASKKTKKTYRFIETIDLTSLKCIINEFDEGELDPVYLDAFALFVKHEERYFNTYPFIVKDISMKKDKFLEELVLAYEQSMQLLVDDDNVNNNNNNNDDDDEDIQFLKKGNFHAIDFDHLVLLARSLDKSKYFKRTKERLNRKLSFRRNTSSLLSASLDNISSAASPSRLSKVFSFNFFTPKGNDLNGNQQQQQHHRHHPPIHRQPHQQPQHLSNDLNSFNELTELNNADNFSLPATPIPRKKYYKGAATDLIRSKKI
ncbi:Protein T2 [Dermatophagoides pteronyssinus]|uniref:Protein T2 n=1 Tax=Dermatophagoides pteronyssinus TaxID=6956 RepID=A0ABQ8J2M0_DERPT|nr:Protein T2 [Dermatophagoides pteronyssinus]